MSTSTEVRALRRLARVHGMRVEKRDNGYNLVDSATGVLVLGGGDWWERVDFDDVLDHLRQS